MRQLNVAILGGGTVGSGVYEALRRNDSLLTARLGMRLCIHHIAVRNPQKSRIVEFDPKLISCDWKAAIEDPKTEIVIELIGGTSTAKEIVEQSLLLGKPVVTANKALLSKHGQSLFALAKERQTGLHYEASVGGGIPIIKVLRESLIANRFTRIDGILNGTCNYILTQMESNVKSFSEVLADAQSRGYAESNASLDVDGLDAMHKTGLIASLAHGFWVCPESIPIEGIGGITTLDIEFAKTLGYRIKLLSTIAPHSLDPSPKLQVSVSPTLIPQSHVLANVKGVFNAIFVHGDVVGETLFYGQGAGREATASAVISDVADAARDLMNHRVRIPPKMDHEKGDVLPWKELVGEYYIRLAVIDKPGTMAKIANVLANAQIGISSIIQPEGHEGDTVPLILMIHDAQTAAAQNALAEIGELDVVQASPKMIRVEHFNPN